jgi:acetylornithine deacetylase/succinyl-diaminopimelate desuccinylase-like protein
MDNRHFVEYGIPNFSYGPIGGNLHSSDEWLDLESLMTCTKTLAGVILDWCDVASKDMSDEGSTISLRQEA